MTEGTKLGGEQLKAILADFVGTYVGKGTDTFPTPGGPSVCDYLETMVLSEPFLTTNPGGPGNSQNLLCIGYRTALINANTKAPMHQESGFWMFSSERSLYMKAIAIPRGITILAGGTYAWNAANGLTMNAKAKAGAADFGICNEPFLAQAAPTEEFTISMTHTSKSVSYAESSLLRIQGQSLEHTDSAELMRQ